MRVLLSAGVAALLLVVSACASSGERRGTAEQAPGVERDSEATPDPAQETARDAEPEPQPADVTVSVVASNLEIPWDVAFTGDGRTFVTERDTGVLSELHASGATTEVAVLPVEPAGEGGLLGVAASPDFGEDQTLYVYYSTPADNRIARVSPAGTDAILTGIPRANVHNGGRLAFGPDGLLYASTGDTGQPALAADGASLAGKILRLHRDGAIPDDNPEPGSPVYAMGIRNAQGLAWDTDGTLYITEFGPDVDDAVLRVQPGSDQGWNPRSAGAPPGGRAFPDPLAVEQPPDASWSGAAFLHDGAIPQWDGALFVASLRGQRLWRFDVDTGEAEQLLVGEFGRLRHVAQAPDGSLWVLTSNRDGRGSPAPDDDRILRLGPPG